MRATIAKFTDLRMRPDQHLADSNPVLAWKIHDMVHSFVFIHLLEFFIGMEEERVPLVVCELPLASFFQKEPDKRYKMTSR